MKKHRAFVKRMIKKLVNMNIELQTYKGHLASQIGDNLCEAIAKFDRALMQPRQGKLGCGYR